MHGYVRPRRQRNRGRSAWLGATLPWRDAAVNSKHNCVRAIGRWGTSQTCIGTVGRIAIIASQWRLGPLRHSGRRRPRVRPQRSVTSSADVMVRQARQAHMWQGDGVGQRPWAWQQMAVASSTEPAAGLASTVACAWACVSGGWHSNTECRAW